MENSYLNTLPGICKIGEIIFCLLCMFFLSINDEAKLGFYWTEEAETCLLFIACIFGVVLSTLVLVFVIVRTEERGFVKWMCVAWYTLFIVLCATAILLMISHKKTLLIVAAVFGFIAGFIYFLDGCVNCMLVKHMICYPGCNGRSSRRPSGRSNRSTRKRCCY